MKKAVLIYNPKSGRQKATQRMPILRKLLAEAGYDVKPEPTQGPMDATRIAREHAEEHDIDVAFAMGGDGTLREVSEGLLGSDIVLGPLPEGTANVLAFELGLPRTSLKAAAAMKDAKPRTIDVGMANDVPFLMMASLGLETAVMANQNATLKRWFGPVGVAMNGLRRVFSYKYPPFELILEDGSRESAYFFTVCNIPFFGGPFRIAPEASTDDGMLDLVTFHGRGALKTLALAGGVLFGSRHVKRRDVKIRRVRSLEVVQTLNDGLQVDGDVLDVSNPVEIRVVNRALRVLSLRS
ncbi:MAG: diacylglycerol kinase family lipid kinase [Thermoanaerobaculia bacterium]|nr:diacylglycerol kinase family lipid kinase [Thermoanaerobaculia bacterium]